MKRVNTCITVRRKRFGDVIFFPFLIQTCWKVSTAFNLITPPSSWLVSFFFGPSDFFCGKNRIYRRKTSLLFLFFPSHFFPQKIEFTSKIVRLFSFFAAIPFSFFPQIFFGGLSEYNWTNEFKSKDWVKTLRIGLTCWGTSIIIYISSFF